MVGGGVEASDIVLRSRKGPQRCAAQEVGAAHPLHRKEHQANIMEAFMWSVFFFLIIVPVVAVSPHGPAGWTSLSV